MLTKDECTDLKKKLYSENKHVWNSIDDLEKERAMLYCDEYKTFLNIAKTERETVTKVLNTAKKEGFVLAEDATLNSEKLMWNFRGCAAALAVKGKRPVTEGVKLIGSHVDAPRLDLRRHPLFQEEDMAFLKSQSYGGIKEYQWTCIYLAIHGIITLLDGSTLTVVIGENEDDIAFTINDLLPHLGRKAQLSKTMSEGVTADKLTLLVGAAPLNTTEKIKDSVKLSILNILNKKYGLVENDFMTAELELVPAGPARNIGFDSSMVGAYGQDDRSCAYASLKSIIELEEPEYTSICLFIDKEEIGSNGSTGAQGNFLELLMYDILRNEEIDYKADTLTRIFARSLAISADVTAAIDPNWKEVHEIRNNAHLGHGVYIIKAGGGAGKYSSNEASSSFAGKLRTMLNSNEVIYQYGSMGKLGVGGGGTICRYIAERGIDSIDMGTPILNMHAPLEVCHKADLYMTYRAYKSFYESKTI